MSIHLQKTPFLIDFLGNDPKFTIRTQPYSTAGRSYSRVFAFTSLTAGTLTLTTPYFTLTFSVIATDTDGEFTLQACATIAATYLQLVKKLKYNHTIRSWYDVKLTQTEDAAKLTLTDLTKTAPSTAITLTSSGDAAEVTVSSTTTGLDRMAKDKYRIAAYYEITAGGRTCTTPLFYFNDVNNRVAIGTKMLEPYCPDPDIPAYLETAGATECASAIAQVKLLFAESVAGNIGFVKQSGVKYLINGRLEQYERDNNLPDWSSANGERFLRATGIDIFGQDNADTLITDAETEQFLYVSNFTASDKEATLQYSAVRNDGTADSLAAVCTLTVPARSVVRIPVSPAAMSVANAANVVSYAVRVNSGDTSITRSFTMAARPYNARTLLVLNAVNLYESFTIYDMAEEITTSGELVVRNGWREYLVNDEYAEYTARTGMMTKRQMQRLKNALAKSGNLLLDGQYALHITIEPASYTVMDEDEDMISMEFKFVTGEKIDRAAARLTTIAAADTIARTDSLIAAYLAAET